MSSKNVQKDRSEPARHWTKEEARECLKAQASSGQSIHAFARAHGYSSTRLYTWARRLAGDSIPTQRSEKCGAEPSLAFIPVRVTGDEVQVVSPTDSGVLELVLAPRRVVRIPPGFDEPTLLRLLHVLDSEVSC